MSDVIGPTLLPGGLRFEAGGRVRAVWPGGEASTDPVGVVVVGRDPDCGLVIASRTVSRRHARLAFAPDGAVLEDLGSSAGTFVAGRRVAPGERVPVAPGVLVELGEAVLLVPSRDGPPATEPSLDRIAASAIGVLLQGETGVGKDVVARELHARSPRARGPFVAVNCTALPEALVESELFGHERGAFTGADRVRTGLLESANGGTLFLDELGDMPLVAQPKLLRALEQRQIVPVGGNRPRPVDFRLVAATHRDLRAAATAGSFREDLYWRVAGITLRIPPLRERIAELPSLADALLRELAPGATPALTAGALAALAAHDWPGNVRELKNVLQRALLVGGDPIEPSALGLRPAPERDRGLEAELAAVERARIAAALERCGGNQTKAARELGMPLRTLVDRLDRYGFPRPRRKR